MAYDFENQMSYWEDNIGNTTYFAYDPFMHLKEDNNVATTARWHMWLEDMIVRTFDTGGGTRAYTTNDGVIVGEVDDLTGTPATTYYLTDLLGSVTGTHFTGTFPTTSRRFTPYGRLMTGTALTPYVPAWIGGHGYYNNDLPWAEYMAWHRFVSTRTSQWTTRDLLWPDELPYGYAWGNPTTWSDPNGLGPCTLQIPRNSIADTPCSDKAGRSAWNTYIYKYCKCAKTRETKLRCDELSREYYKKCKGQPGAGPFAPGPSGIVPLDVQKCFVYQCEWKPGHYAGLAPGHLFICASITGKGRRRKCSAGLSPFSNTAPGWTPGYVSDTDYDCPPTNEPEIKCRLVWAGSGDDLQCRYAGALCDCIDRLPPKQDYNFWTRNCTHFVGELDECAKAAAMKSWAKGKQ